MKESTKLIHSGQSYAKENKMPATPICQASTVLFPNFEEFADVEYSHAYPNDARPSTLYYGRNGTQTQFGLEEAIADFQGYDNCLVTATGVSAINMSITAFVKSGDHVLLVSGIFSKTRRFCEDVLKGLGVEVEFYSSSITSEEIEKLIKLNTKLIVMESPLSLVYEIQDVGAICEVAKKHNIITMIDDSWSGGMYFKPANFGVDIAFQSVTKYISGHSDLMLGAVCMNKKHYDTIFQMFRLWGNTAGPLDCYLAHRGLKTMKVRMEHIFKSTLKVAEWLENRKDVTKVFYPALKSHKNHELWKRDFTGANGLITVILNKKYSLETLGKMFDGFQYFGLGHSWGGCESIAMPVELGDLGDDNTALRIHVGLEDVDDLIKDLEEGLKKLKG